MATDAHVLIGGRRNGYQGATPGVIEETVIAIATGEPGFLAAGFGGRTFDAARALGLAPTDWPDLPTAPPPASLRARDAASLIALGLEPAIKGAFGGHG